MTGPLARALHRPPGMRPTFSLLLALAGCADLKSLPPAETDGDSDSDGDTDGDFDETARYFEPDHVVEVEIEMAASDWDALRTETRRFEDLFAGDCLADPFGSPFTYFPATVTVDGETLEDVGVRKKGLLGSLSETKPSLKLDFGELVEGRELHDLSKMTLNNAISDPAYVRQCIVYGLFADAGIAAPRCNFAHVTVNGRDLGVYVHLESVGKRFLRESFGDDTGNLYEGTLSDFRPQWVGTFEKKTNELDPDRSDLGRVVEALEADDASLESSLDEVIDLDQFLTYWGMEVLTAHFDGYASNTNNFFVYHEPASDRLSFFPWGTDGAMHRGNFFGGDSFVSVYATALLPRRLYQDRALQARYFDRLRALLDSVWREDEIADEIDRMADLVLPYLPDGEASMLPAAVAQVEDFVRGQRDAIASEIGTPPVWTQPLRDPPCFVDVGTTSGAFETTWGTIGAEDPFATGTGSLEATIDGADLGVLLTGSTAGYAEDGSGRATVNVVSWLDDSTAAVAAFSIPPEAFVPGVDLDVGLFAVAGGLYSYDPATGEVAVIGILDGGTLHLDDAGFGDGAAVRGRFEASLIDFPWF